MSRTYLNRPGISLVMEKTEFCNALASALEKNACVSFFCNCEVVYSGRAEAYLPKGDRSILIKADNTLHIHQPTGATPVNYMKPGTSIAIDAQKGKLVLNCKNAKDKDFLDVHIHAVYSFQMRKLIDAQKLTLVGNESDMSDMIKENPTLIEDGFSPLTREEHTKVGFIDIFGYDDRGNLVVVECKRYTAGLAAVTQLRRYVEKIKKVRGIESVRGVMASPAISTNAEEYLKELGFSWVCVNPPKHLERYNKNQLNLGDY